MGHGACVYPRLKTTCKENNMKVREQVPQSCIKKENHTKPKKGRWKRKQQQIQKKGKWKNRISGEKKRKETTNQKWRKHEANRKRKENRNGNGKIQKMRQGKRRKTNKEQKKTYRRKRKIKRQNRNNASETKKKTEQETLGRKTWTMIQHVGQKEKPAFSFAHMHTLHNWSSFCALRKKALWGWVLGWTCLQPCEH